MRAALLLAAALPLAAAEAPRPPVEAVEFPYYAYPPSLWERELVWLKAIGVRTVAFSIPWNWHQPEPGAPDFAGKTNPRRDLLAWVRLLRRLELRAWVRPLPPVIDWAGGGTPAWAAQDRRAQRAWLRELERLLEPQTVPHGGPVEYVERAPGFLGLPPPPAPVTVLEAGDAGALARSRAALAAGHGSVLWRGVENTLFPAGWQPPGVALIRRGAVGFGGDERRGATSALRRNAPLLRHWAPLIARMRPHAKPALRPASGKFPAGVTATELVSPAASAISVINRGLQPYRGDIRVWDPVERRPLVIPGVEVPAGEALWLPVGIALEGGGLCRDCSGLAGVERVVYSTAELQTVEFENGILAMEFAAPTAGHVLLQLSRRPAGPLLAAGRPTEFEFDEKTFRARLPVPAGAGPGQRVRIGLALEAPEASAFFVEARRLLAGRKNVVATSYSSPQLAGRSRLRLPNGWTAKPVPKSPNEIDYEIDVPAAVPHGDWADLAIEADGVLLGRARVQVLRPVSVRLGGAAALHFGDEALASDPPVLAIDPRGGHNLDLVIRNNSPAIQTYRVELAGDGFEFFPASAEISVGAGLERTLAVRVFAESARDGLHEIRARLSGAAEWELPLRLVLVPRGRSVIWSADLDGDGSPEWALENQRVRAVFSAGDGGRWLEFVWKDAGTNFLPEAGACAAVGPAVIRASGGQRLEIVTSAGTRTLSLAGTTLAIEHSNPPKETVPGRERGGITLRITRPTPTRTLYTLGK